MHLGLLKGWPPMLYMQYLAFRGEKKSCYVFCLTSNLNGSKVTLYRLTLKIRDLPQTFSIWLVSLWCMRLICCDLLS